LLIDVAQARRAAIVLVMPEFHATPDNQSALAAAAKAEIADRSAAEGNFGKLNRKPDLGAAFSNH
jgi:hypothetical protein